MIMILVVEDTPSERELISGYLRDEGYLVINASNGQEALEKLNDKSPNVVITDLVMPDMSGLELCRKIKKNPATEKLPVIACTSKSQDLDKMWGMKQGIDVYLTKPFTKEDIVRAVRSVSD